MAHRGMADAVPLLTWGEIHLSKMYIVLEISESSERRQAWPRRRAAHSRHTQILSIC